MSTIKISNWDKWQSFRKDRGTPPWIKIHRNLMTNPEWAMLSDSEKGQLVSMWIAAADKTGELSSNPRIIMKICGLDEQPNINKFIQLGFLQPNDNHLSTTCQPNDAPETETETETETEYNNHAIKQVELHAVGKTKRNYSICFDEWWKLYPHKTSPKGKKPSFEIWKRKKIESSGLFEEVMRGTKSYRNFENVKKGYVLNPETFLNKETWADMLDVKEVNEIDDLAERTGVNLIGVR